MISNLLSDSLILKGKEVTLLSMKVDHLPELLKNSREVSIWRYLSINGMDEQIFVAHYKKAIESREVNNEFIFAIFHNATSSIIGSTRYMDMQSEHNKLEIGWTWINPIFWGTQINAEVKYLLLCFAFEKLNAIRVQFKTNEENIRSQRAIEKLGATKEGLLRNWRTRKDGSIHHVYFYSIIKEEWNIIKINLQKTLNYPLS